MLINDKTFELLRCSDTSSEKCAQGIVAILLYMRDTARVSQYVIAFPPVIEYNEHHVPSVELNFSKEGTELHLHGQT